MACLDREPETDRQVNSDPAALAEVIDKADFHRALRGLVLAAVTKRVQMRMGAVSVWRDNDNPRNSRNFELFKKYKSECAPFALEAFRNSFNAESLLYALDILIATESVDGKDLAEERLKQLMPKFVPNSPATSPEVLGMYLSLTKYLLYCKENEKTKDNVK